MFSKSKSMLNSGTDKSDKSGGKGGSMSDKSGGKGGSSSMSSKSKRAAPLDQEARLDMLNGLGTEPTTATTTPETTAPAITNNAPITRSIDRLSMLANDVP